MGKGGPEFVGGDGPGIKIPKFAPRLPGKMGGLAFAGLVLFVIVVALYFSFLEYIRPNEYGIKEVQIGVNRGIQEEVYEPGLALVLPFGMQTIHQLPRSVQVLEMTQRAAGWIAPEAGNSTYATDAATIQTSDGYFVTVDASVLYRIEDPYLVVKNLGPGEQFLHQGMLPKAEPILKRALGQLTTEEFYNSALRVEKADEARDLLNAEMKQWGISVLEVLVRYFKYSDEIQFNIEKKKLQDQLVFLNQSEFKKATERKALNEVIANGEAAVNLAMQAGANYEIEKRAEQEEKVRTIEAQADLLVELAKAESTRLKNEAMEVVGADRKVAMTMAEVLSGLEVIIMPSGGENSMNPLDLDNVLDTFGVEEFLTPLAETAPRPAQPRPSFSTTTSTQQPTPVVNEEAVQ